MIKENVFLYIPGSICIIPLTIYCFIYVVMKYAKISKEMRRIGQSVYSPIYTHLNESTDGISTIRTFKKTHQFENRYCELQDRAYIVRMIDYGTFYWLKIRLHMISIIFIAFYYLNCIFYKEENDTVLAGLIIGYLTSLQWRMIWVINDIVSINSNMVCFERCLKLLEIPQESEQRKLIPTDENNLLWISKGHIKFKNYSAKYRPETEMVLKNINIEIKPKEKVGIVGRTGSGKSTLCLSLCRILEAYSGDIEIDGIAISSVGISDLRDKITIIPQEPILFNNTLKFNLDPENKRSNKEIINLLEKACLKSLLTRDCNGLDFKITEKGSNLSAGERALICICRAILRKNKVVILDEATASIDVNTEATIQMLINDEFHNSTILIVAHRLNTIMHCDKVAVMSYGKIVEFDSVDKLKSNPKSEFSLLLSNFTK